MNQVIVTSREPVLVGPVNFAEVPLEPVSLDCVLNTPGKEKGYPAGWSNCWIITKIQHRPDYAAAVLFYAVQFDLVPQNFVALQGFVHSYCQALATFGPAAFEHGPAIAGLHPGAKPVGALSADIRWLKSSFWHILFLTPIIKGLADNVKPTLL